MKIHGGFKQGDIVERRVLLETKLPKWIGTYVVLDFKLFEVKIVDKNLMHPTIAFWVSIYDVRHPHLAEKK